MSETDPAVHREEHADHRPRDPERRGGHRKDRVQERVAASSEAETSSAVEIAGAPRLTGASADRLSPRPPTRPASGIQRAARRSTLTALARSAVTTASAVSSEVRHGTRASTAARRMRKPSRSTVFPRVGVLTTAAQRPGAHDAKDLVVALGELADLAHVDRRASGSARPFRSSRRARTRASEAPRRSG